MRLLQTLTGDPFGGVQELFVKCAESFQKQGITQRTFVRDHASFTTRLQAAEVETVTLPLGRWFDFKSIPYIAKEIDRFRPDIILSWKTRAAVMNGHASRFAEHSAVRVGRLDGYYNVRRQINNSDHLIAVTPDILQFAVDNGWPRERISFIPNFPINEPGNESPLPRDSLDIPEDAPLLLAAGRLAPAKRFDVLLHAMKLLEGVFLLLAGEGDERARLVKQARDIGIGSRIRFLGWREDISNLIASADIVVHPSRHESFGIVIVESWASRTPIVACASKGPAWLIRDGLDGLLTPIDDTEALAKSIFRLIENPELRRNLATSGRRRFETEFSRQAIIQRYLDLFRYLIKLRSDSR